MATAVASHGRQQAPTTPWLEYSQCGIGVLCSCRRGSARTRGPQRCPSHRRLGRRGLSGSSPRRSPQRPSGRSSMHGMTGWCLSTEARHDRHPHRSRLTSSRGRFGCPTESARSARRPRRRHGQHRARRRSDPGIQASTLHREGAPRTGICGPQQSTFSQVRSTFHVPHASQSPTSVGGIEALSGLVGLRCRGVARASAPSRGADHACS